MLRPLALAVVTASAFLHVPRATPFARTLTVLDGRARPMFACRSTAYGCASRSAKTAPDAPKSLAAMATRYHALAAINGGYFEAYTAGPIKNLIHTIVVHGTMLFKGDVGDELYIDRGETATTIEHVPLRIQGALDGSYDYPKTGMPTG